MSFQPSVPEPKRPPIAHIVRIGTEKVRSLPYRSTIARARVGGSMPPARAASHVSARATAFAAAAGGSANARAAQASAVVLMLLKLRSVSPQPPSSFWCERSHATPPFTRAMSCADGAAAPRA